MAKVLGNVMIKINGDLCKTVGDSVEFDPGGFERKRMMADGKFHYNEVPIPSKLSCKFLFDERSKLKAMNELAEGSVQIITDTGGLEFSMANATRMGEPCKVSSSDGTIAFEAEGDPIVPPQ